jgi:hypothetical protein
MTGFDIDENNDIFLTAEGNLALVKDIEAVKVAVLCQTRTTYGEVILNTQAGIPYFQTIFTAHPDIELWKKYMKDTILAIPKVLGISDFKTYIQYGKNLLKYAIIINTEYGQEVING